MFKTSSLTLISLAFALSACGRFDFGSRLAQEGHIAEAKYLQVDAGKALGFGVCSAVTITGWAQAGIPGGSLTAVQLTMGGLRTGDVIYSDAACSKSVKSDQLFLPAVAISVTYYVKTATTGTMNLSILSAGDRFAAVTQTLPVGIILASVNFNVGGSSMTTPAGFCSSAVSINLKDGGGNLFVGSNQPVQISGGEGLVYSDSVCTKAIADATLKVTGSSATFYLKKNSALGSATKLMLKDPTNTAVAVSNLSVTFSSAPHHIEIAGGPSTNLVLGVCDSVAYQINLRDIDGNLASASGSGVTVQIATTGGTVVNYRTACDATGVVVTNRVFASGEKTKMIYVQAISQNSVSLRAYLTSAAIGEGAMGPITVDRLPVSLQMVASNPTILAGSPASFTVSMLDGLGTVMPATTNVVVTLSEGSGGYGTFASSAIAILNGNTTSGFTYTPGVNAANFSQTLNSVAVVSNRTIRGSVGLGINARVPVSLLLAGGPGGAVDLGVCQPTSYSVTLLAADNNAVAPLSGSVTVALGFSPGAGTYYGACGGAVITSVTFGVGESVKAFSVLATSDASVTLRATATGLNASSKVVSVNPAVPVSVVLSGPTAITAGIPAGPFQVTVKDAINRNIAASSAFNVPIAIAAGTRSSFCTAAKCSSVTSSLTVAIAQGVAASSNFYLLSDSDNTQSPVAGGMSATPSNGLRPSTLGVSITRSSLALDSTFGANGATSADGGEIHSSFYANGKLVVAGFQNVGGVKRFAVSRFNTDRSSAAIGALDTSFGTAGTSAFTLGDESWASAIAPQGTGYLVAGVQRNGTAPAEYNILLVRLNSDGSLDGTFRFNAGVPDPLQIAGAQYATAMVVGSDNTIYVVGYADAAVPTATNTSDLFIAAFDSSGNPLPNGVETFDFAGDQEIGTTALVETVSGADSILIGGSIGQGSGADALFARVYGFRGYPSTSLLTLDPAFGNAGMVRYDLGSSNGDSIRSMLFQPSTNRVVAVGSRGKASGSSLSMIGLLFNGNTDASFGSSGITNVDIAGVTSAAANGVTQDARTGALYLAGSADSSLLLARYSANGLSDGMASTARVVGTAPVGYSIALGQDSKPLVGGVNNASFNVWGLLR
jgi:uncharacterized delta-60 repeat protein